MIKTRNMLAINFFTLKVVSSNSRLLIQRTVKELPD